MKKNLKSTKLEEKESIGFTISPSENLKKRILGSYSSVKKLKKRIDDDPFPHDFPDDGKNPPPVSAPDIAFQFRPALKDLSIPKLKQKVISSIIAAYGSNTDVRYKGSSSTGTIGIWLKTSNLEIVNQARKNGLKAVNILKQRENFALFVNSTYIKNLTNEVWTAMPKVFNENMIPDKDGPVHLTSLTVLFQSPNIIVTKVGGFDERPWPDVNFTFNIKDTLETSSNEIIVTTNNNLDVDKSVLNLLTGLFLIVFPPLGLVFLTENIIVRVNEGEQDVNEGGAGKQAASLIPKEIMIEDGKKLVFFYNRINVTIGGIFSGGAVLPVERTPSVKISGPSRLTSYSTSTYIMKKYYAIPEDLRGNSQYCWKVNGKTVVDDLKSPTIRFNFGVVKPGQIITKTLSVTVTDLDGLTATMEKEVTIYISFERDDLPPVCRIKPYLPQCQPESNN